ncbi:MAG: hypothetical protein PHX25_00945 [Candidatus Pacebacteria bacterium]|nr:hypothetical protein [Candidatus Paceibacterota bacterium]
MSCEKKWDGKNCKNACRKNECPSPNDFCVSESGAGERKPRVGRLLMVHSKSMFPAATTTTPK